MVCVEFTVRRRKICPTCGAVWQGEVDEEQVEKQYWLARSLQDALQDEHGSKFCGLSVVSYHELNAPQVEGLRAKARDFDDVARDVYRRPYAFKLDVPEGV